MHSLVSVAGLLLFLVSSPSHSEEPGNAIEIPSGSAGIGSTTFATHLFSNAFSFPRVGRGRLSSSIPHPGHWKTVAGFSSIDRYGGGHGEGIPSATAWPRVGLRRERVVDIRGS